MNQSHKLYPDASSMALDTFGKLHMAPIRDHSELIQTQTPHLSIRTDISGAAKKHTFSLLHTLQLDSTSRLEAL